ncbi:BrnA antitoxin family protein [Bdellovibrio svalbardensis]|uniref:BrnA antitoxin family protein n=1 Tax=Bdellovibrio svalbardensis TaxID=2972972 RepID=A0ABT6DQE5_9BACT|nr:BrnA antitoxin family protein [Bdellovibrio svalbardensis]MDG0817368.1 BrnA antitoxin family protein [Bdellovibrio svalbardensis]
MRKEYDFSAAKKNPYAKKLKTRMTIRLDDDVMSYFQMLADETEIPYQTLINLYLKDCVKRKMKPDMAWKKK